MRSSTRTALVLALALGAAPLATARAQDADLVFWQSIQNSTNPAEYQAYLDAFPNGKFRVLALLRVKHPPAAKPAVGAAPAPAPARTPVAAPEANNPAAAPANPCPGIVGDCTNKVVVKPTVARVGQKFRVSFVNFPDPDADIFMIVRAGTPDFNPISPPPETKPIWYTTIWKRNNLTDLVIGPFAPGKYEARYMTKLYNNDGRYETSARTMFSVR